MRHCFIIGIAVDFAMTSCRTGRVSGECARIYPSSSKIILKRRSYSAPRVEIVSANAAEEISTLAETLLRHQLGHHWNDGQGVGNHRHREGRGARLTRDKGGR